VLICVSIHLIKGRTVRHTTTCPQIWITQQ